MSTMDFTAETPQNWDIKCCCTLVLDVSDSMKGSPIKELNDGLQNFHKEIKADMTSARRLEVAIVKFSSKVEILVSPKLVTGFTMPILVTGGTTKLANGVREGLSVARNRKNWYREKGLSYYRPWVILITDGAPDNDQDIRALATEIKAGMKNKEFFFIAIGVQSANMTMLKQISDDNFPPMKLQGIKFSEFFKWLSASMAAVTKSNNGDKVDLPDPGAWMMGYSI